MTRKRVDPEEMLKRINAAEQKKSRGHLKIYLGAAPGVGKTYTMLQDAKLKREQGLDVVVGVVESHGRVDIQKLLVGLEELPKQKVDYKGRKLEEFDIDGALLRNPGLILIDEMAHSNVDGLRHAKRWQDIKELLDRGVDVYTTLNVQHIESLNDDVSGIINAPIKETVPDSMIELADTIELVDLPPEELLTRLHEGKVYFPSQASIAKDNFFRKGNLTALRELALRVTAARVGAQVLLYRQGQGIKHIWSSNEKILVCVGPGVESLKIIRAARRLATTLQAEWIAVYVDSARAGDIEEERNNAIKNLRVAEKLGAETIILTGFDIVKELMDYAREQNCTLIMVWKNVRSRWKDLWRNRLADEIVRNSYEINVYIMTGSLESLHDRSPIERHKRQRISKMYMLAMLAVAIATILNLLLYRFVGLKSLVLVYIVAITTVSLFGKIGPSLFASFLSIIAYVWFFMPGLLSFSSTNIEYISILAIMILLTQLISYLTVITRKQALAARKLEKQATDLHKLSKKLAGTRGADELLSIGTKYVAEVFDSEVMALLEEGNQLVKRVVSGSTKDIDEKEFAVAQWVYELGQNAGLGTDTLPLSEALYIPLLASEGAIGVLRIIPKHADQLFTPDQMNFLETCANQLALALEVDFFQESRKKTEFESQLDQARQILLKAVTRDLRVPLASIMLTATTQMQTAKKLDEAKVRELGQAIYTETERLSILINNLLQISSIETNAITVNIQLNSFRDLMKQVVQKCRSKLGKRPVYIRIPTELPDFSFDSKLLAEVIMNLLDNAFKYGPDDHPIEIIAAQENNKVIVSIGDHGPGIPDKDLEKIFEKFYIVKKGHAQQSGLGLGLAICKILIEAQGGKIWAENRIGGGAILKLSLPLTSSS